MGRLIAVFTLLLATAARAETSIAELFSGTGRHAGSFYELGLTWGLGGLLHAPGAQPIGMTGVRFVQHQGFISQLIILAAGQLGVVLSATSVQIESEYETRTDRFGREYKVETTRTTTIRQIKSSDQVEAELAEARNLDGLVSWFEVTVYAPKVLGFAPGPSSSSGYELSIGASLQLGTLFRLPIVLSAGVSGANVRSPLSWVSTPGAATELTYENLGLIGRLHVPLTRFADVALEWQPNVYTIVYLSDDPAQTGKVAPSPLRAIGYLHLTDYLYVRGQVVLGGFGFTEGRLGYALELGGRL